MRQFTILTLLSVLFLTVLVAPMPSDKRDGQAYHATGEATASNSQTGKCGIQTNVGVAIPSGLYGSGHHCGQPVTIATNGKEVIGKVSDECFSCAANSITMSLELLRELLGTAAQFGQTVKVNWSVPG